MPYNRLVNSDSTSAGLRVVKTIPRRASGACRSGEGDCVARIRVHTGRCTPTAPGVQTLLVAAAAAPGEKKNSSAGQVWRQHIWDISFLKQRACLVQICSCRRWCQCVSRPHFYERKRFDPSCCQNRSYSKGVVFAVVSVLTKATSAALPLTQYLDH